MSSVSVSDYYPFVSSVSVSESKKSAIVMKESDIALHVGLTYFQRGKRYFNQGKILTTFFDGKKTITGYVRGRARDPYEVIIELAADGKSIMNSECSCPMGYACKHVAALGLQALKCIKSGAGGDIEPKWKRELLQLVPVIEEKKINHLALLCQIDTIKQGYYGEGKSERVLQFRPMHWNAVQKKYSLTHVKWNDFSYGILHKCKGVPEKQQRWFKQFFSTLSGSYRSNGMWKTLHPENAEYAWFLLLQQQRYGIPVFFDKSKKLSVSFDSTPLRGELSVEDEKGQLGVYAYPMLGEKRLRECDFLLLGEPPVFAMVTPDGNRTTECSLHPVSTVEHIPKNLLNLNDRIVIPEKERESFEKEILPSLASKYPIHTNVSDMEIPKSLSPKGCIVVERAGKSNDIIVKPLLQYGTERLDMNHTETVLTIDKQPYVLDSDHADVIRRKLRSYFSEHYHPQDPTALSSKYHLAELAAADFIQHGVPILRDDPDLVVDVADDVPSFKEMKQEPEISFSIEEGNTTDWFDLNITVSIGENGVQLSAIIEALSKEQTHLFLDNGEYFSLQHPNLERLRKLIDEAKGLVDIDGNTVSVSRFQASLWDELQQLGVVKKQAAVWQKSMKGLLSIKRIGTAQPPKELQATLRPYQKTGWRWLKFLYDHRLGGILADDMGLGKTVQAIALLCHIYPNGQKVHAAPTLIIAPTSVVENWASELAKFAPHLTVTVMRCGDRKDALKTMDKNHIILTSYHLMLRDFEALKDIHWSCMILDEAQYLKNHRSKMYGAVRKLSAISRIALTGTPMENNTMELWSIISIVAPGLFSSPKHFREHYQIPIEKHQDKEVLERLQRRIRPFLLRRNKSLIAKELPPKIEQVMRLEMDDAQRHLYDVHLQKERQRVLGLLKSGGLKEHRMEIFRSLMRLRQFCLHPGLVDDKYDKKPSAKLDCLLQQLETIVSEGHKVLVFSQFTSFLSKVQIALQNDNIAFCYLDGSTKNRKKVIEEFRGNNSIPVFLISLKAGGLGLNLTEADYCILLDPWWNPAVENQAVDRTHRIGQKNQVYVYKMIMKDTIEEKVLALQQKKKKLFDSVLEKGGAFGSQVTEKDIRAIFE